MKKTFLIILVLIVIAIITTAVFYDFGFNKGGYDFLLLKKDSEGNFGMKYTQGFGIKYKSDFEIWRFSHNLRDGVVEKRVFPK